MRQVTKGLAQILHQATPEAVDAKIAAGTGADAYRA
jgi:hypothetical protein